MSCRTAVVLLLSLSFVPKMLAAYPPPASATDGKIYALTFSSDGRTAATLGTGNKFALWDVATGKARETRALSTDPGMAPRSVGFDRDSKPFVLLHGVQSLPNRRTAAAQRVRVWHLESGRKSPEIRFGGSGPFAVSPCGKWLATNTTLWEVATGKKIRDLAIDDFFLVCVEFSPDSALLVYLQTDGLAGNSSRVFIIDRKSGKTVLKVGDREWKNQAFDYFSLPVFSPDSRAIAFMCSSSTV